MVVFILNHIIACQLPVICVDRTWNRSPHIACQYTWRWVECTRKYFPFELVLFIYNVLSKHSNCSLYRSKTAQMCKMSLKTFLLIILGFPHFIWRLPELYSSDHHIALACAVNLNWFALAPRVPHGELLTWDLIQLKGLNYDFLACI